MSQANGASGANGANGVNGAKEVSEASGVNGWTLEEDYLLLSLVLEKGWRWTEISNRFLNHTSQQCRYRYIKHLNLGPHVITDSDRSIIKQMYLEGQSIDDIYRSIRKPREYLQTEITKLDGFDIVDISYPVICDYTKYCLMCNLFPGIPH